MKAPKRFKIFGGKKSTERLTHEEEAEEKNARRWWLLGLKATKAEKETGWRVTAPIGPPPLGTAGAQGAVTGFMQGRNKTRPPEPLEIFTMGSTLLC